MCFDVLRYGHFGHMKFEYLQIKPCNLHTNVTATQSNVSTMTSCYQASHEITNIHTEFILNTIIVFI